jgi:hypothetical protein
MIDFWSAASAAPGELYNGVVNHLNELTKVVKAARALGWGAVGLKEAHDLYKMFTETGKK